MKRSIVALLVGAALVAACGSSDDADSSGDTTVADTEPVDTEPVDTAAPVTDAVATTQATTTVPTTDAPVTTLAEPEATVAEGGDDAGMTADEQAAADAWSTVFDSTIEFVDKEAHLADAIALQPTLEAYTAAGSGFGGINLAPTSVVVDGDTAAVIYDVNFGENPAYTDQEGSIGLVDGVWVVDRAEFCAFMSSARVSCP